MKKQSIILVFVVGVLNTVLCSCSSIQTFTVRGVPGTVISKNDMEIAVIDQTGQAQIKTNRESGYQHFYLAKAPNSNIQVPFALDYENHDRSTVLNLGKGIGLIGFGAECAGLIMVVASLKSNDKSMLGIGGVVFGGGFLLSLPALIHAFPKKELDYNYDYLQQTTNNDLIQ